MLNDTQIGIRSKRKLSISLVQKFLLCVILFLLPVSVIPFSWDWTERAMSLTILFFSTAIVTLEIVKLIWGGKLSLVKSSIDIGIFFLLGSFLLSTIFSKDINSSIWGVDGRLGNSLIMLLTIIFLTFSARSFVKSVEDIKHLFFAFLSGLFLSNVLSIFSFFGVNIWKFIPTYRDMYQPGLPLLRSARVHLLTNITGLLLSLSFLGYYFISKTKFLVLVVSVLTLLSSVVNIWLFSIGQGLPLVILLLLSLIFVFVLALKKLRLTPQINKELVVVVSVVFLLVFVPVALLRFHSVREAVIPEGVNVVGQVSLGNDVSWIVSSSTLSTSFVRGFFGYGVDNYSIAYNQFKPLSTTLLLYNDISFFYSGNEVFTQLTNGGILWLAVWIFIGYLIVRALILDIKRIRVYQDASSSWFLIISDISILSIYVASFFAVYSVLNLLLLIFFVSIRSVLKDILTKGTEEKIVFKLWAVNVNSDKDASRLVRNINTVLTLLVVGIAVILLVLWGTKVVSSAYLLRAESYFIEENRRFQDVVKPSIEEREEFVRRMSGYYEKSVKFDKRNPLVQRKYGLMLLEKVGLAAERYSKEKGAQTANAQIMSEIGQWKNGSIDAVRKSVDISPKIYSNNEAMVSVYMGLVGMGFYDYVSDAVYSVDKALELNPFNFQMYYSKAQIFVLKGEQDSALATLSKVLSINPEHIPSLVLAADINKQKGNLIAYESYLNAAKTILEKQKSTENDVYKQIVKLLGEVKSPTESAN